MKWLIQILTIICVALASASCSKTTETASSTSHATIYFGGDILTMQGDTPVYVEALVEQDGKIAFVGSRSEAEKTYGSSASNTNLNGATLLPGFIDGHGHVFMTGYLTQMASILPPPDGPGDSFETLVETTRNWKDSEKGEFIISKLGWVIANGYDDSQLLEKAHPTRDVLDQVSTELPVVFIHQSGHLAVLNSKGLELVGYDHLTVDPEGGIIRRDSEGHPNGVLEETAFFNALMPILKSVDPELLSNAVDLGQKEYARFGYTTAQDGRTTPDATLAFETASAQGDLFIDIVSYPDISWNRKAIEGEYYSSSYQGNYRVGGAKLTLDGSPQGKTAWLSHPYHVAPDGQSADYDGYPIMEDDLASELVALAMDNRWQLLVHANGDAAIDQFIHSMEKLGSAAQEQDHRNVLIHGQTLRKDQIQNLVDLGIVPSLFPMHTYYWGDWHRDSVLGPERARYISPMRDVVDAGLRPTSHHDAPVTIPNSMRVLDATVNRVTRSGKVLGADQRLTPYEALKTLTIWAARQNFEADQKGTLKTGKLADFTILSDNPLKVAPQDIHQIKVLKTIKEGAVVFPQK
ncbi:MAG: amidohydrolase [Maricaulaceae bacterium]